MNRNFFFFPILLLGFTLVSMTQAASDIVASYNATSQVLKIPKLGVPSGDAGYAYQVDMKLIDADPITFLPLTINLTGAINADEPLSAIYVNETRAIYFPVILIIHEDNTTTTLNEISISLGADPFAWFYLSPQ